MLFSSVPMLTCSLRVHNSLRDALPVEVGHLVSEDHILNQQRTPRPCSLQVQFVSHRMAGSCGQRVGFLLQKRSTQVRQFSRRRITLHLMCLEVLVNLSSLSITLNYSVLFTPALSLLFVKSLEILISFS